MPREIEDPEPEWERSPQRTDRLRQVLERRQPDLTVIVENFHDMHNVAAIMRTCDAVGVPDIHLLYNIEEPPDFERWGKNSSKGTRKWMIRHNHSRVDECIAAVRGKGLTVLAATLDPDAPPPFGMNFTKPVALLFGNEHRGLSAEALAAADGRFRIPMMGVAQSLNVSVAAAVTLYEVLRQRTAAGMYDKPRMPPERIAALLEHWKRM